MGNRCSGFQTLGMGVRVGSSDVVITQHIGMLVVVELFCTLNVVVDT